MTEPGQRVRLDHLPERLGDALDDGVEEARIHAMWKGSRKRAARLERRRGQARVAAGVGGVALVALAALALWPGPSELRTREGGLPSASETEDDAASIALDDGSSITLATDTRWIPLANEGALFESEVSRGAVTFDVEPGGPRRWRVHAADVRVEVLGTRFTVRHDADAVVVSVDRGHVAVIRGDARHDLRAGERWEGALAPPPVAAAVPASEPVPEAEPASESEPEAEPASASESEAEPAAESESEPEPEPAPAAAPGWRDLAARGDHARAYDRLGAEGIRRGAHSSQDAGQLMLLADVARLSGHPGDAVAPLERLLSQHPADPRAPVAAVVLGRLEMDSLGRPERARRAFERALDLDVPAPLRADVLRRLDALDAE